MEVDEIVVFFVRGLLWKWGRTGETFIESPEYHVPKDIFDAMVKEFEDTGFVVRYRGVIPMISRDGLVFDSVPKWFEEEAKGFQRVIKRRRKNAK